LALSSGDLSSRSCAVTLGKPQYIITIPELNHNRKSKESATPSQRWTKMMAFRIAIIAL
jgi:hypothetical protein